VKTRLFIALVLTVGMALLLAWAVAAQETTIGVNGPSAPYAVSTNHGIPHPDRQNVVSLGYTLDITFTPAFTIYLPSTLKNYSPPFPLLTLRFEGSFAGEEGEQGFASGPTFATGYSGLGVLFDDNDTLYYATDSNIDRERGDIAFWLKPSWAGNDGQGYVFFEVGDGWFNRMRIMKDGANNFRFMVWSSDTEYDAAYSVASWAADEWHHVRVTWQDDTIALYLDGVLRNTESPVVMPSALSSWMYIGSSSWQGMQAHSVIDEFIIYSRP